MIKNRIGSLLFKRALIYFCGATVIFIMLYANAYKSRSIEYSNYGNGPNRHEYFKVDTFEKFDEAEVMLEFDNGLSLDNLEVKITKIISKISEEKKKTITRQEDLRDILFDNNDTNFPNGTIFSFKKDIFILSKGELRRFSSKKVFKTLGFDDSLLRKINKKEFSQFELGKNIDENLILKKELPQGMIIKSGNDFFITGTSSVYPIFSETLITKVWDDFVYSKTNSLFPNEMTNSQCFIKSETTAFCQANIQNLNLKSGDIYFFKMIGVPVDSIKKIDIKLKRNISLKNLWSVFW